MKRQKLDQLFSRIETAYNENSQARSIVQDLTDNLDTDNACGSVLNAEQLAELLLLQKVQKNGSRKV